MAGEEKGQGLPRGLLDRSGAPAGRHSRLTRILSSRELTLGGVPKKVFTPNIAGIVNKNKNKAASSSETVKSEEGSSEASYNVRGKQGRKNDRGRGDGRGRGRGREANLIQTHSVFEQAPTIPKSTAESGSSYGSVSGGGGGGRRNMSDAPSTSQRNYSRDGIKGPEKRLDGYDTSHVPLDVSKEAPLILSGSEMSLLSVVKAPLGDKKRPDSTDQQSQHSQTVENDNCAQVFQDAAKSDKEQLLLIELPNILPGTSANTVKDSGDDKNENDSALRDFSEGFLGKLQIRKSGKVELKLGEVVCEVSKGVPVSFLQEIISVHTDPGDEHMTVLGNVQEQLIFSPDIESMLLSSKNKKR